VSRRGGQGFPGPADLPGAAGTRHPLYYHAGQFVNLRRADGLVRSYSLASVPRHDQHLEVHVKRLQNGRMSNWICDELQVDDALDLSGPHGECFYVPGNSDQAVLLIGTGTELAPLLGIVRDALGSGHQGPVHLYHGSHEHTGLYAMDLLQSLVEQYPHFHYTPCVSGPSGPTPMRAGRADDNAFADLPNLRGWRVFLCGNPLMVRSARKKAYLAGVDMAEIYVDPFEVADLRRKPRA
jgi:NAD(P)H-flavin reductase